MLKPIKKRLRPNSLKETLSTTSNAADTAIRLVKECSDAFPPLKAPANAVVFVVDECKRYIRNSKAFEDLVKQLQRMNSLLKPYKNGEADLPLRVKEQVQEFDRTMSGICQEVENFKSRGNFWRFANSRENEERVAALVQRVKTAVEETMLASLLDISSGVKQVSHVVQEIALATSLRELKPVHGARYDRVDQSQCLEGTRVSVLADIQTWFSSGEEQFYWLNGAAGMGKTTVACSVAHRLDSGHDTLLGTFFCSRESADRRTSGRIFPTLACQLAKQNREYRIALVEALREHDDIGSAKPKDQLQRLIVEPLQKIEFSAPVALVVDALDECDDEKTSEDVLLALFEHACGIPSLKVFVSCRPANSVERQLSSGPNRRMFQLHDVETSVVVSDLRRFYNDRLGKVRAEQGLVQDWPSAKLVGKLVQHAAGLFIFADTVCKYLASTSDPQSQLARLANMSMAQYKDSLSVDMLYTEVLSTAIGNMPDIEGDSSRRNFARVLASVMVVEEPVTIDTLGPLLGIEPSVVCNLLRDIHPILSAPRDAATGKDELIYTFHASFPDYMAAHDRAGKRVPEIFIPSDEQHLELTLCCLKCMNRELERLPPYTGARDSSIILEWPRPVSEDSNIESQSPDAPGENISDPLRYACLYWIEHLYIAHYYLIYASADVTLQKSAVSDELQEMVTKWSFYLENLRTLGISDSALRRMVEYGELLALLIGNDRREFYWSAFFSIIKSIISLLRFERQGI